VTLFVYPSAISNASYALTWEQLAEMQASGFAEVQSHSYWHPKFTAEKKRLSPEDYSRFVAMQLGRPRETIAARLGRPVDLLAWPFGIHDAELEAAAARAGYVAAFTLERRAVRRGQPLLTLPRFLVTDADRGPAFAALLAGGADARPAHEAPSPLPPRAIGPPSARTASARSRSPTSCSTPRVCGRISTCARAGRATMRRSSGSRPSAQRASQEPSGMGISTSSCSANSCAASPASLSTSTAPSISSHRSG